MFTFVGRALADRVTPTSPAWRTASDIDPIVVATALGLSPGEVPSVEVIEVDHGTSQRSRLLVRQADGSTTSLFAKNTPIKFGAGVLDGAAKLCEREADFYRHVAPNLTTAPQALISEWDPRTGRSTVVLPDLTDRGFVFRPGAEACSPEQVRLALEGLARLHASNHATAGSRADHALYVLDTPASRRLNWLVCRVVGRASGSLRGLVPDVVLERSRVLATHAQGYADVLAAFPQAFIHNDTHRGNIGFASDRAIFIDWQFCGWGPAVKDVAYLMSTALEPEERRIHERDLLDHYLAEVRSAGGRAMSPDDAWFAYRVLAITGYVAAAVTVRFRNRLQAAANAEESVRRAAAAVADLDSFSALCQLIDNPRRFP